METLKLTTLSSFLSIFLDKIIYELLFTQINSNWKLERVYNDHVHWLIWAMNGEYTALVIVMKSETNSK
jgi:hypothetical protein